MSSLSSNLQFFKVSRPEMRTFLGDRSIDPLNPPIFLDSPACLGERVCTVRSINKAFEQSINPVGLLQRMGWMMDYLQEGYHAGYYGGIPGEYENANEEYPVLYEALVRGLSDRTLEIISHMDFSDSGGIISSDMGQKFYNQLLADREILMVPEPATADAILV